MSDLQQQSWFVDDEARNARYYFRPIFEFNEDDFEFEQQEPEWSLVDLVVTTAEEFDERGQVIQQWTEPESRRFDDRAWRLLQQDTAFFEHLESIADQLSQTIPENPPSTAAETLAKMRSQRMINQEDNEDQQTSDRKIG